MKVKKIHLLCWVICILVCSAGCNKKLSEDSKSEQNTNNIEIKSDTTDGAINIQTTLSSGVVVDVEQIIPKNINYDSMPIIRAECQEYNADFYQNYFMKNKEIKQIDQGENKESGGTYKYMIADDGSSLSVTKYNVSYTSQLFREVNSLASNVIKGNIRPEDKPVKKLDFAFATREEAYNKAKEVLQGLGISVYEQYECYSLPFEWLKKEV